MTSGHNNRKGRNKGHRHSGQRPRGPQPANAPIVQPKPAAATPLAPPAKPPSPAPSTFGPPKDAASPPPAISVPQQVAHSEQAPGAAERAAETVDAAPLAEDVTPALPPLTEEPRLEPERFQAHGPRVEPHPELRQVPRARHPLPTPAPAPPRPQSQRDTAPRPPLTRPRLGEAGQPYLPHGANGHQNGQLTSAHNGYTRDHMAEPPASAELPSRSERFVLTDRATASDWRDDERDDHDDRDDRDDRDEASARSQRQIDVRGEVGPLIDSLRALFADNRTVASQGGVARCGICYLYFRAGDLIYREQEGFYVCASCAAALGATRLPMVRRQQR